MSLDVIFPTRVWNDTEAEELHRILNEPIVRQYLVAIVTDSTKELLTLSILNKPDAEIAKIHAKVQGRIEIANTLLSI